MSIYDLSRSGIDDISSRILFSLRPSSLLLSLCPPHFLCLPFHPVFRWPVNRDVSGRHLGDNVIERFLVGLLASMVEVSDRRESTMQKEFVFFCISILGNTSRAFHLIVFHPERVSVPVNSSKFNASIFGSSPRFPKFYFSVFLWIIDFIVSFQRLIHARNS